MNTEEINRNVRTREKTTAKKLKDSEPSSIFACISLFRRFVYFSLLPASTPLDAHELWLDRRISYLNRRRSVPYLQTDYYLDAEDEPVSLNDRQSMYCSTSNIREFYLHTFISYSDPEVPSLYSISLIAEGGIYSVQIEARSLDDVLRALQVEKKHIFDEYLSDLKSYHDFLADADSYRLLQEEYPKIWVASAYSDKDGLECVNPNRRGKERVFSQNHLTLFIIPTRKALEEKPCKA